MNPSVLAKIETVAESNRWEDGSWNADISSKKRKSYLSEVVWISDL
jgi:hypothetical protein